MPHLTILAIGKIKKKEFSQLEEEYLKRLSHYVSCELVSIKDSHRAQPDEKIKEESIALQKKLTPGDLVLVLDEKGKNLTSIELASEIQKYQNQGVKRLVFIVGGAYGLSPELKKSASRLISLSTLTLPHELARVVLLEQLYRAHTILKGEKYHH